MACYLGTFGNAWLEAISLEVLFDLYLILIPSFPGKFLGYLGRVSCTSPETHFLRNWPKQDPPVPYEGNAGRCLVIFFGSINCGDAFPEHSLQYCEKLKPPSAVFPFFL